MQQQQRRQEEANDEGDEDGTKSEAAAAENLQNYHATRLKLQKFFIIHFVAAVESSRRVSEIFA